nr:DUF4229 domain-containing protein [Zhihengliuella flava]
MKFTLLRLALFLAVFAFIYWVIGWNLWVAAVLGLVIAFAVSYLFFNSLRLQAVNEMADRMAGRRGQAARIAEEDAAAEDEAMEQADRRRGESTSD